MRKMRPDSVTMPGSRWLLTVALLILSPLHAGTQVLQVGNPGMPASLDPHRITGVWENRIVGDMFVGLTTEGADGSIQPGAAASWEVSADGLVWTFSLREQRWSDGTALTADDFVYSFRRMLDPATTCAYADFFFVIEGAEEYFSAGGAGKLGVTALDRQLLEIRLHRPVAYFPGLLMHFAAMPVPRHVVEEYGQDWTRPEHIVVNGPFRLTEQIPNARVVLEKNPEFYAAADVALAGVVYHVQESRDALVQRFRSGELHVAVDFPSNRTDWLRETLGEAVRTAPQFGLTFIAVNHQHPALADLRVRTALALALDREVIARRLLGSGEQPALSLVPPGTANYREPARSPFAGQARSERIAAARELLDAAGYGPQRPLRLGLRVPLSDNDRRVAVAAQSMWAEIGVRVEISRAETAVHYGNLQRGEFDLGLASWLAIYSDPQTFTLLLDSGTAANNFGGYRNDEYDRLTRAAAAEVDIARRAELLHQAEELALRDHGLIPVFHHSSRNLVANSVGGWCDNPLDVHRSRYLQLLPAGQRQADGCR